MSELQANPIKGAASDVQIAAKSISGLLNPQTGKVNEKKTEVQATEVKKEPEQTAPVQEQQVATEEPVSLESETDQPGVQTEAQTETEQAKALQERRALGDEPSCSQTGGGQAGSPIGAIISAVIPGDAEQNCTATGPAKVTPPPAPTPVTPTKPSTPTNTATKPLSVDP